MRYAIFLILASTLFITTFVTATSIPLLAVSEQGTNITGTLATLDLDTRNGTGRVFLDTSPLTQIGTQVSLRFAQQISCKTLDLDCTTYDFLYTIHSFPGLVGGPSAGAAAAILTTAHLTNIPLRNNIAITGTINSGGIIGPVGGITQKIDAAAQHGITTLLIPTSNTIDEETNTSYVDYGKPKSVTIIHVTTLQEAFTYFTGRELTIPTYNITITPYYQKTMRNVADNLCTRYQNMKQQLTTPLNDSLNLSTNAAIAMNATNYYSAASFCFRLNIQAKTQLLKQNHTNTTEARHRLQQAEQDLALFEQTIDNKELTTLTDLQTYMVVKERIEETRELLNATRTAINTDLTRAPAQLAFAEERLNSAHSWATFFDTGNDTLIITPSQLRTSCTNKIDEAEERLAYVSTLLPRTLLNSNKELIQAYKELNTDHYALCLFKASKAKAEADIILQSGHHTTEFILKKLAIAQQAISNAQHKGVFPLIGYSYYEYAKSLTATDPDTALLFSEYALEFANLDLYFDNAQTLPHIVSQQPSLPFGPYALLLSTGFLAGILITRLILRKNKEAHTRTHLHFSRNSDRKQP